MFRETRRARPCRSFPPSGVSRGRTVGHPAPVYSGLPSAPGGVGRAPGRGACKKTEHSGPAVRGGGGPQVWAAGRVKVRGSLGFAEEAWSTLGPGAPRTPVRIAGSRPLLSTGPGLGRQCPPFPPGVPDPAPSQTTRA